MTNQKNSGRCWLFAALNVMRRPLMKKLNIEDFEFSQSYMFYWDKVSSFSTPKTKHLQNNCEAVKLK